MMRLERALSHWRRQSRRRIRRRNRWDTRDGLCECGHGQCHCPPPDETTSFLPYRDGSLLLANTGHYIQMTAEAGSGKSGGALLCPAPIAKLRVEKIEGGLVVAGVVVAANCQIALPVFGCLFVLVGIVLTVASYRGPGHDEAPENYAARLAFTGNSRVLGPACIVVGFLMLMAGVSLCLLTRRARRRECRVGFHCPVHGDFYPLSPITRAKAVAKTESGWRLCFGREDRSEAEVLPRAPPQCPHTFMSSTRSSVSSSPLSPCPTPMPFLVNSGSISSGLVNSAGANLSPDQTFGSIRSLSVSREVASFPLSRTPSPPLSRRNSDESPDDSNVKNVGEVLIENELVRNNNYNNINNNYPVTTCVIQTGEVTVVAPAIRPQAVTAVTHMSGTPAVAHVKGPRKSVSIILPDDDNSPEG